MSEDKKKQLPSGISIRKDGRYQARYMFRGKRHTIYAKDLKEIQRKLRDVKYEMDHGIYTKPDKLTVDSWYKTWMKEYRENIVRETTIIGNKKCYKHVQQEIGYMKLQAVRPEHIQKILNKMQREGYSKGYIENTRKTMNMMFHQEWYYFCKSSGKVHSSKSEGKRRKFTPPGAYRTGAKSIFRVCCKKKAVLCGDILYRLLHWYEGGRDQRTGMAGY